MSYHHLSQLNQCTKLVILILIVIATELNSNLAIYLATAVWLELSLIVRAERNIIMWFKKGKENE